MRKYGMWCIKMQQLIYNFVPKIKLETKRSLFNFRKFRYQKKKKLDKKRKSNRLKISSLSRAFVRKRTILSNTYSYKYFNFSIY
jgi:hypothetical protein